MAKPSMPWLRPRAEAARAAFFRALHAVGDLVLPEGCCGCGRYVPSGEGPWCTPCALALGRTVGLPYCPRCGLTCDVPIGPADGCPRCMGHRVLADGFARVGEYDGRLAELIRKFKYARQQQLDQPLGAMLAEALRRHPWVTELDALVPVPLSWRGRLGYRFSPPEALARQAGAAVDLPILPLLRERGKRRRQVGLSVAERRRNVRGAYRLRSGARPAGAILCVIDDVSTTGSTIQEVARVLKEAGATRVYAAVLAKTNPERANLLKA